MDRLATSTGKYFWMAGPVGRIYDAPARDDTTTDGPRLETAGEIEMTMRMKRVLYSVVASCALAGALYMPARAAGLNIETAPIADLSGAFADGTLTSEQLVSAYLKRIEAYDEQGPAINAIITLNKNAIDEARQLDAERRSGNVRGPLHGIPVVLKDNYDTVDMPTTAGSQLLEGHMPKQDAFLVKKLREAGAIMLAKVERRSGLHTQRLQLRRRSDEKSTRAPPRSCRIERRHRGGGC